MDSFETILSRFYFGHNSQMDHHRIERPHLARSLSHLPSASSSSTIPPSIALCSPHTYAVPIICVMRHTDDYLYTSDRALRRVYMKTYFEAKPTRRYFIGQMHATWHGNVYIYIYHLTYCNPAIARGQFVIY